MLLTITTTRTPATDLGWLLHKHPDKVQSFNLTFGQAHVFYPEVSDERCTAALVLDVDAVDLARQHRHTGNERLAQYVNDRPYVASSFLSVAISQVYGSALNGSCKTRPELAETPLPLVARIAALPCRRGGEAFLRKLFEPLGYTITATRHTLDPQFPEWGDSPYFTVELQGNVRLAELLSHIYVLVPVLDDEKHYWVSNDEVDKLLRHGEGWLNTHPERETIASRYLRRQGKLVKFALANLTPDEPAADEDEAVTQDLAEERLESRTTLHEHRLNAVLAALQSTGAKRVLDLGCGEGKLLRLLVADPRFAEIVGVDVCVRSLEIARQRLDRQRFPDDAKNRITLLHGSLTYRDSRLQNFDAAAVVEVIEHLELNRLAAFEDAIFAAAHPQAIVLTTPNREYNVRFENLAAGKFRHGDHRFEWTRAEFADWCARICATHGYTVRIEPLGTLDPEVGPPSQMAVFAKLRIEN